MENEIKLKPCPCCNLMGILIRVGQNDYAQWRLGCPRCEYRISPYKGELSEAIALWNEIEREEDRIKAAVIRVIVAWQWGDLIETFYDKNQDILEEPQPITELQTRTAPRTMIVSAEQFVNEVLNGNEK